LSGGFFGKSLGGNGGGKNFWGPPLFLGGFQFFPKFFGFLQKPIKKPKSLSHGGKGAPTKAGKTYGIWGKKFPIGKGGPGKKNGVLICGGPWNFF